MKVVGVIPCRYQSKRFPGKPIALICGKPLVYHVWRQARQAKLLDRVLVATDDNRIFDVCSGFGMNVTLTSDAHETGTDRVAEVAERIAGDVLVNVQGDEPLIEPSCIDSVVVELQKSNDEMVTNAYSVITDLNDIANKNIVKVVTSINNYALTYSRSVIPYSKDSRTIYKRQFGLYAMRRNAILKFPLFSRGYLERAEEIEMFRFVENDYRVRMVEVADSRSISVDVPDDIQRVEARMTFSQK